MQDSKKGAYRSNMNVRRTSSIDATFGPAPTVTLGPVSNKSNHDLGPLDERFPGQESTNGAGSRGNGSAKNRETKLIKIAKAPRRNFGQQQSGTGNTGYFQLGETQTLDMD